MNGAFPFAARSENDDRFLGLFFERSFVVTRRHDLAVADQARIEGQVFEAFQDLQALANDGNYQAMLELGKIYYYGRPGISRNQDRGFELVSRAAAAGEPAAKARLLIWENLDFLIANGRRAARRAFYNEDDAYSPQRNYALETEAASLVEDGADLGNHILIELSMGRATGYRTSDDEGGGATIWPAPSDALSDAFGYARQWAQSGSFQGAGRFSNIIVEVQSAHLTDNERAANLAYEAELSREAQSYLRRAIERGCKTCLREMADLFGKGTALENGQQEIYYLEQAVAAGLINLDNRIGRLYWTGGVGLPESPERAVSKLETDPRSSRDFEILAIAHFTGTGVEKDGDLGFHFARQRFEMDVQSDEQLTYLAAKHFDELGDRNRAQTYFAICGANIFARLGLGSEGSEARRSECEDRMRRDWNRLSVSGRRAYLRDICFEYALYAGLDERPETIQVYFKCDGRTPRYVQNNELTDILDRHLDFDRIIN